MSKNQTTTYSRNIVLNYFFSFIKSSSITQGIWMLYLASKGYSLYEIGLLEGIFHVTSFTMEVPTGAIADIYGKKTSRILGLFLMIASAGFMLTASNFSQVTFAFILSALSYNLESGAGEAFLYDTLKIQGKEGDFMKINGHTQVLFYIASCLALVIGGYIGNMSYALVYYFEILIAIMCCCIAFLFKEPIVQTAEKTKHSMTATIKKQFVDCHLIIHKNAKLAYLIVFSSVTSVAITLSFYYLQILWKNQSFLPSQIGILLALSSFFGILGAHFAVKVEEKMGAKNILISFPVVMALLIYCLSMKATGLVIGSFVLLTFLEAVTYVVLSDYINKEIPSEIRATVLSFSSTMFSLSMILCFPAFGYLSDQLTIPYAFSVFSVLIGLAGLVNALYLRNKSV